MYFIVFFKLIEIILIYFGKFRVIFVCKFLRKKLLFSNMVEENSF